MSIETLTKFVQRKQEERERYEQQAKKRDERAREISDAKQIALMEFWCSVHGDFSVLSHKEVLHDYSTIPTTLLARYTPIPTAIAKFYNHRRRSVSFGKPCKRVYRYITDKHLDPYYRDSEMIQRQRVDFERDLIQPWDPRFKLLYGDPYKKYYEQLEAAERAKFKKKIQVGT